MFSNKKHQKVELLFENEGWWADSHEQLSDLPSTRTSEDPWKSEFQKKQDLLQKKQDSFLASRNKVVSLANSLESIALQKVDAVMQTTLYIEISNSEERKNKIQQLISEFIEKFKPEFDSFKMNLESMNPPLSKEEIEEQLQDYESQAFEQFINLKFREQGIEKSKQKRKQKYLSALVFTGNQEQDARNQELVAWFQVDYLGAKKKIIEEHPELRENKEWLKTAIQKALDEQFVEYCKTNDIPIDEGLLWEENSQSESHNETEGDEQFVRIESRGSMLMVQQDYMAAARDLSNASELYNEELEQYDKAERIELWNNVVYEIPKSIVELPPWETTTFVGSIGWSETLYEATREPNGDYSLSFQGITLVDLKKEDLEIVLNINDIPIISILFSRNSNLYKILRDEYWNAWNNKFKNPPDWFIEYVYDRLNQAYLATWPKSKEWSFLGMPLPEGAQEQKGRYIRNVLTTNISIRDEALSRLHEQKIIVSWKINLSLFPI